MDWRDNGAFTGEISPLMLIELGVKPVLIGHHERRQFFGETNQTVNSHLKAWHFARKLARLFCVSETLDEAQNPELRTQSSDVKVRDRLLLKIPP